jgi:hypothetical protein
LILIIIINSDGFIGGGAETGALPFMVNRLLFSPLTLPLMQERFFFFILFYLFFILIDFFSFLCKYRGDLRVSFTFSAFQVYNNRLYDLITENEVRIQKNSISNQYKARQKDQEHNKLLKDKYNIQQKKQSGLKNPQQRIIIPPSNDPSAGPLITADNIVVASSATNIIPTHVPILGLSEHHFVTNDQFQALLDNALLHHAIRAGAFFFFFFFFFCE